MSIKLRLIAVALGLLLMAAPAVGAEPYRDAARHYSLTIPPGWKAMPPNAVMMINNMVRQKMPGVDIRYDGAFQLQGQQPGAYPYILVQVQPIPGGGASYEQIEAELAKGVKEGIKKVEGPISDLAKNLSVGTPALDRTRNRVVTRIEMDVLGVGRIQGLSVGFLGANDMVYLHCYAREADFPKYLPTFDALLESFRFDPGYAFVPQSNDPFWRGIGSGALVGAVAGGLAGIFAGGLILIIRKLLKKPEGTW
jgi:hypothetical protein